MADVLGNNYEKVLRERNAYRRELELYRQAFEAMVEVNGAEELGEGRRWTYRHSREAERAIRQILRHRARSGPEVGGLID